MIDGKFKIVDWERYESPRFSPAIRSDCGRWNTCGAAALGLITGIKARSVEKHLPGRLKHFYTTTFQNFLKNRGYTVIPVEKNSVTAISDFDWRAGKQSLNSKHLLVINAQVVNNKQDSENSFYITHDNFVWHNYEKNQLTGLYFFNKPPQDVLLVWHPKWA